MALCPVCSKEFRRNYAGRVCCSHPCLEKHRGSYEDRFWARVKRTKKCWEWQGTLEDSGYARVRRNKSRARVPVHRLSWELVNGPIPKGLLVLHKCDNRKCVRPGHLFLGTHQDNSQDMLKKGRANKAKGERHGHAKLTEPDVIEILASLGSMSYEKLAVKYGVGYMTIYRIANGTRWAHIPRS